MALRIAVLTISDMASAGKRTDVSGDTVVRWAEERGYRVTTRDTVPDESDRIAARLVRWADDDVADVIVTTGGTGLAPRDVTPEATQVVVERVVPGIAEAIRAAARHSTPRSVLSRGLAGTRAQSLIINLPGAPKGVEDGLDTIGPILEHAVQVLKSLPTDHS